MRYTCWQNLCSRWRKWESKVLDGGNERARVATPTSITIFNSCDMKSLWLEFGYDIFTGLKMPRQLTYLKIHFIKQLKNRYPKFRSLPFWIHWRYYDMIWIKSTSYHKNQILKTLIPALWNIDILLHEQSNQIKHFDSDCKGRVHKYCSIFAHSLKEVLSKNWIRWVFQKPGSKVIKLKQLTYPPLFLI